MEHLQKVIEAQIRFVLLKIDCLFLNYFVELDLRKRINDVKEIDRHMYRVCCDLSEDISTTRIRIDYKMHRLNVFL